ncbi:MAG: hypothetical protein ACUVXB_08475, partial [Bryobacteraceae bacterium]
RTAPQPVPGPGLIDGLGAPLYPLTWLMCDAAVRPCWSLWRTTAELRVSPALAAALLAAVAVDYRV